MKTSKHRNSFVEDLMRLCVKHSVKIECKESELGLGLELEHCSDFETGEDLFAIDWVSHSRDLEVIK